MPWHLAGTMLPKHPLDMATALPSRSLPEKQATLPWCFASLTQVSKPGQMDLPGSAWVAACALASQLLGFPYQSFQQPPPKPNNLQGARCHRPQRLVTAPVGVFGEGA